MADTISIEIAFSLNIDWWKVIRDQPVDIEQ
jgi:hypothetical protein